MTDEQKLRVKQVVRATQSGWRAGVKEVCWTLGLADEEGSPSLSRAFAAFFALAAVHGRLWDETPIGGWDVAMAFCSACSYFGLKGLAIFGRAAARRESGAFKAVTPDAGPG